MNYPMHVDLSVDKEMTLTRTLDAPRDLVWKCWTDPVHLARWWGPKAFTNRCELDVRPGGQQIMVMISPDGQEYPVRSTYLEVVDGEKLVGTLTLDDHPPEWHELYAAYRGAGNAELITLLMTVTFEDAAPGQTRLTVTQRFKSNADRDANMKMGAKAGWSESFHKLDALVIAIAATNQA